MLAMSRQREGERVAVAVWVWMAFNVEKIRTEAAAATDSLRGPEAKNQPAGDSSSKTETKSKVQAKRWSCLLAAVLRAFQA